MLQICKLLHFPKFSFESIFHMLIEIGQFSDKQHTLDVGLNFSRLQIE